MMKLRLILLAFLLSLGFVLVGHAEKISSATQYLYIQSASSAELSKVAGPGDAYLLTLKNVNGLMTCFSERPKRTASTTHVKAFIDAWLHPLPTDHNHFKDNAPNADLNGIEVASQNQINMPVVLSDPQYNANEKTLTYRVNPLEGGQALSAMKLEHVTLIIDYCTSCPR